MPSPDLGLNGPFLQRRLPDWLKHSTPAAFKHLSRSQLAEQGDVLGLAAWFTGAPAVEQQRLIAAQAQSRLSGRMLAVLLKDLKGIAAFAEPLLLARLKADYPALQIDVNTCQFVQITRESTGNGRWEDVSATRQSLLQAALQNFAASASFVAGSGLSSDGAYSLENHVIYQSPTVRYAAPVAISPSAFAGLCHALDLGQQYQQHLSTVFESPATQASLKQQWISVYKDLLRVRLQVALMKSEITDAARQALLALLQGKPDVRLNGKPVVVRQLSMYGVALADVWMISADRVASDVEEPVVVYLPGAPLYPLREYPSVKAFRDDLRINLRSPAYRQLLRGYVPREQAQWFFATLQQNLYHKVIGRDDVWESVFDPAASLKLRDLPLAGELFDTLYTQHLQKLKADARVLAVPSAKADEKARAERLAYWASVGLNVLNAAAFFVPYLGEVMAVVAAEQLIHSVIDGAHAWETGDRATAWAHLESVAINMAMVAGLAAVGAALPKVSPSELVDGLLPIELPGGERRLWRVDLSPYANPVELADVVPDAQGLYRLAGKQYVRIDQGVYEVSQDANGVWRIEHGVADAYRPVLRSNNQGAWQAYGEQPLKWSRAQLLRRLGPLTDGLSDAELAQAAEICATSDDVLRQVHVDQLPVPGLLADTLRRMRLDRQITRLVEGTRTGVGKGDGLGFLPALAVQLPRWPGRLLEVFSGPEPWGDSIVYGREAFGDGPVIKVTREQVHAAKLPEILLQALDEPACQQLFGDSVEPQARLQVLRDRLADQAEQRR
ncbi:hypothetical protein G3435_08615, partial [Pseudomonas sp. MAFF212428]|nr:hypothetical protein [Pseudomonas brassicae]NER65663.1 hypothetical protein [Pseudomonas brassicae]